MHTPLHDNQYGSFISNACRHTKRSKDLISCSANSNFRISQKLITYPKTQLET